MALQPSDLKGRMSEANRELCDNIETLIDEQLETDYDDGHPVTVVLDADMHWNKVVEEELKRRYHGWDLAYDTDEPGEGNQKWVTLTPLT